MPYHKHISDTVKAGDNSLGAQLGRAAVRLGFSVARIATLTGATRATVYSWYHGNNVSNAYRTRVSELLNILREAATANAAWSKACQAFRIPKTSNPAKSSGSPTPT